MTQKGFTDFARVCSLKEDKYLTVCDIDLIFFTTFVPLTSQQIETAAKNIKFLYRCQFLEAVVKLSIDKYLKPKKTANLVIAIKKILLENIIPPYKEILGLQRDWKSKKMDYLIKKHWELMEYLFKTYSRREKSNLMSFFEFKEMIFEGNLISKSFIERDLDQALRTSVGFHPENVRVNEKNNRNLLLNYLEFIDCLVRCSQNCLLAPLGEKEGDWGLEVKRKLPLYLKMESFLRVLIKSFWNEKFERFSNDRSEFYDEIQVFKKGNKGVINRKEHDNKNFNGELEKTIHMTMIAKKFAKKMKKTLN